MKINHFTHSHSLNVVINWIQHFSPFPPHQLILEISIASLKSLEQKLNFLFYFFPLALIQ